MSSNFTIDFCTCPTLRLNPVHGFAEKYLQRARAHAGMPNEEDQGGWLSMKFLSRVVWSEGMHLGPHHFQTQSRYFEDSLWFHSANLRQNPWGLINFALDSEAIRNGVAILTFASGIFPDGLIFDLPGSDAAPESVNLTEMFSPEDTELILHVAVPLRKDHGLDCDDIGQTETRYSPVQRSLRDETISEDEATVTFGRKNLVLQSQSQLSKTSASIPLARIRRDGRGGFLADPAFIPPNLRIGASEALILVLQRIVEAIESKLSTVNRGKKTPGQFEAGTSALDVSNYWFLHAMCSALPMLRNHLSEKRSHPEDVYHDLIRFAGSLCTFSVESNPSDLPAYSHTDLSTVFLALEAHIRHHLDIVVPSNAITLDFQKSEPYIFTAKLIDERSVRNSRWIFGIRSDIGESNLLRLVPKRAKVCSAEGVPKLVTRALPGLELTHLPVPPSALPARVDMHYFSISLEGPCWQHILQTKAVGIYLPEEFGKSSFEVTIITENNA
jgi:type VI secretion system protein ImpJ